MEHLTFSGFFFFFWGAFGVFSLTSSLHGELLSFSVYDPFSNLGMRFRFRKYDGGEGAMLCVCVESLFRTDKIRRTNETLHRSNNLSCNLFSVDFFPPLLIKAPVFMVSLVTTLKIYFLCTENKA